MDKLLSGELKSWGYDTSVPLGQPILNIPADLWRILKPNTEDLSAELDGRKIVGIVVAGRDEALPTTENTKQLEAAGPVITKVRLLINVPSRAASLDGAPLQLTRRTFSVLLVLAEAAGSGLGPVPAAKIKQKLMSGQTSDRAVSDAMRDLREQLAPALRSQQAPTEFIQTRTGLGYILALQSEEVVIEL